MEKISLKEHPNLDIDRIRRFQNSKIEIYQYTNEPLIRPKTITQEYRASFEQKQLFNKSSNFLSNISNQLYLSFFEEKPIKLINHKMKRLFHKKTIVPFEYQENNLEMNYKKYVKMIRFEKIQFEDEFIKLCELIKNPKFDNIMKKQKTIARWILSHEYLIYHPDYEKIREKYLKVLCPSYIYTEENHHENREDNYNLKIEENINSAENDNAEESIYPEDNESQEPYYAENGDEYAEENTVFYDINDNENNNNNANNQIDPDCYD